MTTRRSFLSLLGLFPFFAAEVRAAGEAPAIPPADIPIPLGLSPAAAFNGVLVCDYFMICTKDCSLALRPGHDFVMMEKGSIVVDGPRFIAVDDAQ